MSEFDGEYAPGLPGPLPEGEQMLWQGTPDWRVLARSAFHTRWVAAYFAALALVGAAAGAMGGALLTIVAGGLCLAVLGGIAWAQAKATIYTITSRRVIIRAGLAVPTSINLPLKWVGAADLHPLGHGHGDIALSISGGSKLAYWLLWPHARPWRFSSPQPMLRALPEVESVAALLTRAAAEVAPIERRIVTETAPRDHSLAGAAGSLA